MSSITILNQLLDTIVKYRISGYLKVTEAYEPDYSAPEELIYRFKSAVISEPKIDNEDPRTFIEQLNVLYKHVLQAIHKKLDSSKDLIFKNRVFEEALIDINSVLEIITTRSPNIQISNRVDIKYIGQAEFSKLERELFKVVTTKITSTILIPLRLSLLKEQSLLPYTTSSIALGQQGTKSAKYIIPEPMIFTLHKLMNEIVFEDMEPILFLSCFDERNGPTSFPPYRRGYQNIMVYVLSKIHIENANQFVKKNFNIKSFKSLKSTDKARTPRGEKLKLRKKIDDLFDKQ